MARFTDAIITINTEDYEAAKKFRLRPQGNVHYIPGVGVDTWKLQKALPKREELSKQLQLDGSECLLISVGDINANKNNKVVIEAMKALNNPQIHYLICGVGEGRAKLYNFAKKNDLQKNVHFLGYRTDIPEILKSCDIFLLPSYREGLSRSLMEAMACGLPCIVSKIRGNVDLINDGEGGFLHQPNDKDKLAKCIKLLLSDKKLRETMGALNRKEVRRCSKEVVNNELGIIYNRYL